MATVLGAMPFYGQIHPEVAVAFWVGASKLHRWMPTRAQSSLLALAFNGLWCSMLQARESGAVDPDYFVMLHSDVIPEPLWVDKLVAEIQWTQADVLSVAIPIKSAEGVTSTAIEDPEDEWLPLRRLTTREIQALPETFSIADCGYTDGRALLVNTGCWIADLRKPWVSEFPGFGVRDKIRRGKDGKAQAVCIPEDWGWSRWLHGQGCKVLATRKVAVEHLGEGRYRNRNAWGADVDVAYGYKHGGEPLPGLAGTPAGRLADARGGAVPGGPGPGQVGAGAGRLEGQEHGRTGTNGHAGCQR